MHFVIFPSFVSGEKKALLFSFHLISFIHQYLFVFSILFPLFWWHCSELDVSMFSMYSFIIINIRWLFFLHKLNHFSLKLRCNFFFADDFFPYLFFYFSPSFLFCSEWRTLSFHSNLCTCLYFGTTMNWNEMKKKEYYYIFMTFNRYIQSRWNLYLFYFTFENLHVLFMKRFSFTNVKKEDDLV